jgi:hypothetical protein
MRAAASACGAGPIREVFYEVTQQETSVSVESDGFLVKSRGSFETSRTIYACSALLRLGTSKWPGVSLPEGGSRAQRLAGLWGVPKITALLMLAYLAAAAFAGPGSALPLPFTGWSWRGSAPKAPPESHPAGPSNRCVVEEPPIGRFSRPGYLQLPRSPASSRRRRGASGWRHGRRRWRARRCRPGPARIPCRRVVRC